MWSPGLCPWPGQPLLGPVDHLILFPVLANSPWMGPELAGYFAETSGAFVLVQAPSSVPASGFWELCQAWLTLRTPCWLVFQGWFPNVSATACKTL